MVQAIRDRKVRNLAAAAAKCSAEASNYGRCVIADYTSVGKDTCVKEFAQLRICYVAAIARAR